MQTNILFEPIDKTIISPGTKKLPHPEIEKEIKGFFAECILFGDRITLSITGPNLKLITLFRWLGKVLVEKLIEEEIVNFIFSPGMITYLTTENIRSLKLSSPPGLNMLVGVGPKWENPYDATYIAMKEQTDYSPEYIRHISKLVNSKTIITKLDEIHRNVNEVSKEDIRGSLGEELGFKNIENPDSGNLPKELMHNYMDVGRSNNILYMASSANCNEIFGDDFTNKLIKHRLSKLTKTIEKNIEDFQTVLQFENIPDFGEMLDSRKITFEKLIKFRESKNTIKFREWLSKVDGDTQIEVIREYSRSVFEKVSETKNFKALKIVLYTGIGLGLAPLDLMVGAVAGLGLNLFDTYLLNKLINKWNPKVFIAELKKISAL